MRHLKSKKTLDRKTGPRKALIKTLADQFILFESMETTDARAKVVRSYVERLVTKSKVQTIANIRYARAHLTTPNAVQKLFRELGKRFKETPGGYTRIIKLGRRTGDAGNTVRLEFVK